LEDLNRYGSLSSQIIDFFLNRLLFFGHLACLAARPPLEPLRYHRDVCLATPSPKRSQSIPRRENHGYRPMSRLSGWLTAFGPQTTRPIPPKSPSEDLVSINPRNRGPKFYAPLKQRTVRLRRQVRGLAMRIRAGALLITLAAGVFLPASISESQAGAAPSQATTAVGNMKRIIVPEKGRPQTITAANPDIDSTNPAVSELPNPNARQAQKSGRLVVRPQR
jgi:hypothetical protein